ncbi:MAG: leucine-rich repeat protein, partial [Bacteroidales bacterium]|nr:leucine-rich repeat protein [Bacteroidales bacterium]
GSYAFSNSPIEHVLCESTTPPTGDAGCFSTYVYQTAVLEVPVIAEELYRDSQPWKSFSHIVTNTSEDCIFIDDYILNKTSDNTVSIIRYRGNSDTLTIPQSITYDSITYTVNAIADIVFYNNNILQSIKIPNSVISIGKSCFEGCSSLKSISIPSSIEEIGTNAFYKCNELESLYIQDIGAWCEIRFDNKNSNPMSMVQHIYLNEEEITNTSLTIPPTTTLINDYAFAETGFTNFILPDEVTSIGNSAFEGCVKLKAITLPNALVSLGNSAFKYCYSLETVTMPSELKTISADAFYDCYALTEVNLNDGLVSISDDAFYNCSMTSIEFPNTLESIGSYAFYCCPLSGIRLPDGLKSLGNGAFEYCNSLTEAYLGKSLQMIPFAAFMNCFSLTHVEIPETVTDIFDAAFAWCSLSEMPMNDNIRYIGNDAFEYNPFSVFRLGKSVTTIGWGAFHSCKNITDVVIGDQVTDLGEAAFENCNNLESVVIGEGLRFIESYIFDYCDKIHHVTIGSNVRAISYGAFYGCPDITDITCKAKNPPIVYYNNYESCFSNSCFDNTTIFVPMGSVEAYKNADQWKKFKHIVGICMSDIAGDTNCDQEVNIADINALLNTILDGEYDSDMDVNGDGEIDIADINAIINLILSSGR